MAARGACSPRDETFSPTGDGAAAAADTPDEIARITDALCLEARAQLADIKASGEEARSSTLRWPPGTTVTSAGAHRKARSLDYKSGDVGTRGPRQSLSGSLSVLPQTHTPEWASLPVTHPCADCQRASSSYATRRASGLTLHMPPPLGSEPSPPGASPGERGVGPAPALRRRVLSHSSTEQGEEEEEREEEAQRAGVLQVSPGLATSLLTPAVERRLSKRERNRMKILRRRQRRRDRWIQSQLQEHRQSSTGNVTTSSSEDEDLPAGDRDGFICAVCLDVYFSPYMCHPCNHVFCEPCLRTLAKNSPANTPCPLCRTLITHVFFQKGFRRQASPITRRQFPHGGYRLDALDLEDDSRGWRFDMDMVIIYIYSVNWVIGFILFCFLCYLFFPSF
ncbi:hypothetical protein COCON_G00153210 [Conger conger]|uniref:E3 ubiquitin-protein ligase RNF180 n=1 Tax=Conger conger TaxID=82655 RepID=A0A9Q1D9J1_CONCO|nr:hypothetical protein COCON_G00153210 [Conger conger]